MFSIAAVAQILVVTATHLCESYPQAKAAHILCACRCMVAAMRHRKASLAYACMPYVCVSPLAQVNVEVADAGADRGRVVVANETMRRGDLLAAIPVDLCFHIDGLRANTSWGVRQQL